MVALISELCYALYLLNEIKEVNGSDEDWNFVYGYCKDLYHKIEFMAENPSMTYEIDRDTHDRVVEKGILYYGREAS